MKSTSNQSLRENILENLRQCRNSTLDLFVAIDQESFCQQAHADFSPIGWHLGHIAFTEAYWILEYLAGLPPIFPEYHQLFAADGLPKSQRQNLPDIKVILDYLQEVRNKVLAVAETTAIEKNQRLWLWLIEHESQHSETISFICQLLKSNRQANWYISPQSDQDLSSAEMVAIPLGEFEMGSSHILASQDNERPSHRVYLDSYYIDKYPVTCQQYRQFINAGGYSNSKWWSKSGRQWLDNNPVKQPLYWLDSPDWDDHPVCGVSYYEAQAYANFKGKRLPTEAEWEKAASWNNQTQEKYFYPWGNNPPNSQTCNHHHLVSHTTPVNAYDYGQSPSGCYDMLGNVWEWTDSWFAPYPGFTHYPYPGYSQVYFDNQHKVLKGGSWATKPWALRTSFRNWYHPQVRQILAGFRCATS